MITTKQHFNKIANSYEELRPVYTPLMDTLVNVLKIKEEDVVVDYGCGPGHDIKYLEDKYKIRPTGIDKSKDMCYLASTKIGHENVINGDNEYFIQNIKFDKIYFKFVTHHISQPYNFMNELIDCLQIGNSFAIITMLPENLDSYVILKYFPTLRPIIEKEAQKQHNIIQYLKKKSSITLNILECDINEEIFDETLIYKLQKDYSSFFALLDENEKTKGIETIKTEIEYKHNDKHFTRGIIAYGWKRQ